MFFSFWHVEKKTKQNEKQTRKISIFFPFWILSSMQSKSYPIIHAYSCSFMFINICHHSLPSKFSQLAQTITYQLLWHSSLCPPFFSTLEIRLAFSSLSPFFSTLEIRLLLVLSLSIYIYILINMTNIYKIRGMCKDRKLCIFTR